MNLAAMLALGKESGVTEELLRTELGKLHLAGQFQLIVEPAEQYGISGLHCTITAKPSPPHRRLYDILEIIDKSRLAPSIQESAKRIFQRIAKAEAEVHGTTPDEVHFHEVGAVDSIVDIVGAAICRYYLGREENIQEVWSSSIELGGGMLECAHGILPVPAPATVLLARGIPTKQGAVEKEAATPTGTAILAEFADKFTDKPQMTILKTGYGIGHRDNGRGRIANVLRLHLAEVQEESETDTISNAALLQCNIDDMSAEELGFALEKMMQAGAMDCHFTPIIMKKGRPATSLSLLCPIEKEAYFAELLFRHTTTLGLKSFPIKKYELNRRYRKIPTPLGEVAIKEGLLSGSVLKSKPEYEECCKLAERYNKPLGEVFDIIRKSYEK